MPTLFQICVEGNTGSTGTVAEAIGELVMQQGWESYIAYGRFPRSSKSNLIRIGSDFDVLLHGLETRLFDMHGLSSRNATKKLVSQIQNIKPDIIHLHHLHGYYINIKILFDYLSAAHIPIIWTFHDCWALTGHCAHFDFIGCNKWKTACNHCPQKKEYPSSYFIDRSAKNYYLKKRLFTSPEKMMIVSVSDWLKNIVLESFMKEILVETIHNGIDTSIFKPQNNGRDTRAKYGINKKFMLLGVASPWTRKKGLNDFIQLNEFLSEDEIIVLVGLNKGQVEALPTNIIGITRTENKQQLIDLYSAADLFVNPTWEDNFPTTNIEALACGTPVATYNTGGSIEAITPETGFIVQKGSIDGFVKVIKEVKEKGKFSYSEACRKRSLMNYTKNKQFLKYLDIYNSFLNDKHES